MKVEVNTLPVDKEDLEISKKVKEMVADRARVLAKKMNIAESDVGVDLYYNTHKLVSKVGASDSRLGVFSGYIDYEDKICLASPKVIEPIFQDNLWKQVGIMIDYSLYKFYLCKNFFPKKEDYKLYYKYLTDVLARLLSDNYNKETIIFEIRHYSEFKKYKKDAELKMALYIILQKSDISMVLDNLEKFYKDCDVKKTIMKVFKKEFKELVTLYQKELIELDKDLKKVR